MNDQSSQPKTRRRRSLLVPRFGLRALMLLVLLAAVATPVGQYLWPRYVAYREGIEFSSLRTTKEAFVLNQKALRANSPGKSYAVDDAWPMPDDYAVLVRKGKSFGCFIPRDQHKKGESLQYEWYYRTDGLATFTPGDPNVLSGSSFAGPWVSGGEDVQVNFGPFTVSWSGNGPGWGYLYYPSQTSAVPLRICTTNRKTVKYLDGRSQEWVYKAGIDDVGLAGNVDERPQSETVPDSSKPG